MADSEVENISSTPDAAAPDGPRTVVSNRADFSASLDSFQGPLDLLLYLIKENEVEITEIPISTILQQYLRFLDHADQWDLQLAGEFLVMAATLMEIKSRELLPVTDQPEDPGEIIEDPRSELVRQLLEYRRLKEQARILETLADSWQSRRPRGFFGDVPEEVVTDEEGRAIAREALVDVDLFSLFAAYERILKAVMAQTPKGISYDGESIEDKITRIERVLKARPFAKFIELVAEPGSRADIAATFVALLELVRRRAVRLVQTQDFGNIDVKAHDENEAEAISQQEKAAAESASEAALLARSEQEKQGLAAEAASGEKLPWKRRPKTPKFEGILRPEDVEELDAEETEIARRIDAILAAADVISERFEQSRDGRERSGAQPQPQDGQDAPATLAPAAKPAEEPAQKMEHPDGTP